MFLSDRDMEEHWSVSLSLPWKCMHLLECVNLLCPSLFANFTLIASFRVRTVVCFPSLSLLYSLCHHMRVFSISLDTSIFCPLMRRAIPVPLGRSCLISLEEFVYDVCSGTVKPSSLPPLHYSPRQTIMCRKLRANVSRRLISQAYTHQQNLTDTIAWIALWLSINQGTVLTPSHNAQGACCEYLICGDVFYCFPGDMSGSGAWLGEVISYHLQLISTNRGMGKNIWIWVTSKITWLQKCMMLIG